MSPEILHRVCHGNTNPTNPIYATHQLRIQPAILPHHRRHRVRGADYPAIVPHEGSAVRGTYVTGLTDADVWRLDVFEGAEYVRRKARARVLVPGEGEGEVEVEGEEVEAETYVWVADVAELEDREWDFEEFRREKMGFWVGEGGAGEYAGESSSSSSSMGFMKWVWKGDDENWKLTSYLLRYRCRSSRN
jgi:hypothetical protein